MYSLYLNVNNENLNDYKITTTFRINLPLFSTVVPSSIFMFLSCRPFVVITTLSTGLVGVEVNCPSQETEVTSTPTRPVDNVVITTKAYRTET